MRSALIRIGGARCRAGDGWVKTVGDWIYRDRGSAADLEPLWPVTELAEGTARAHDAGARYRAHIRHRDHRCRTGRGGGLHRARHRHDCGADRRCRTARHPGGAHAVASGQIAAECAEMSRAGVPVIDVLATGSWAARAYLGRPAIAEGAPADLVVYPADTRQDIGVLAHPTAVLRRGRVVG